MLQMTVISTTSRRKVGTDEACEYKRKNPASWPGVRSFSVALAIIQSLVRGCV
jgi:hypothetical protein